MSFPKYEHYKDSGVEWLGEVPAHWAVDRLKASIFSSRNGIWGDEAKNDESDLVCIRVADFDRQSLTIKVGEKTIRNITEKERVGRLLRNGNLLLEKSGGGESQPVGCVVLYDSDEPAVCSNFVARVELADGMDPAYWRYLHFAAYSVRLTVGSINQTSGIQNLDQDRYFNERACFPPLKEQQAISCFLARETTKLDALITEQRTLIDLLKEKRQAVISHAVTKGLDPRVPMKDSGVEWLGEVPAHWELSRLKFVASVQTGMAKGKEYGDQETIEVPYLRVANVQDGYLALDNMAMMEIPVTDLARYRLQPGDVLMNEGGDFDKLGRGHVWQGEIDPCIHQNHVFAVRPIGVSPEWLNSYTGTIAAQFYFMTRSKQSTNLASISSTNIMELPLLVPPLEERVKIIEFVAQEKSRLDELTAEAQTTIALLQERRSALISAAVTGKIDVRGRALKEEIMTKPA